MAQCDMCHLTSLGEPAGPGAKKLPLRCGPGGEAKHRLKTPEGKAIYGFAKILDHQGRGFRRFHLSCRSRHGTFTLSQADEK